MEILTHLTELVKTPSDEDLILKCRALLATFIKENEAVFSFADRIEDKEYNELMIAIDSLVSCDHVLSAELLKLIRLFSRDKTIVTTLRDIDLCMKLFSTSFEKECEEGSNEYICKTEVLKCLCNWVYHSEEVRNYYIKKRIMNAMIDNVNVPNCRLKDDIFYQIRLLFLISALEVSVRPQMLECGALHSLVSILDEAMKSSKERLSEAGIQNILTESFKALFNVTLELSNVSSESIACDSAKLVTVLRTMLITFHPFDHNKTDDLLSHITHILLNMQKDAVYCLLTEAESGKEEMDSSKYAYPVMYEKYNVTAVAILLEALEKRSNIGDYTSMKEKCMPILSSFSYVCRINPVIRRYLKTEVLPRLNVSDVRPEQLKGLRGNVIRLMQTVDIPLKNMAADFLFVLCKENIQRLVRYVGYGNSAGFLASRGLMGLSVSPAPDGEYSADELSSEDEEVDIMTGAAAVPKKDVFAEMTEEEKDEEISKLISLTQRLQELNVIKPMKVQSDGKIVEIDKLKSRSDSEED